MNFLNRALKPSFLIIGTQKGGTTSFFHHLALHPALVASKSKELCFFNKTAIYERGTEWYHRQFPSARIWSAKRTFEASPAYLYYPGTAARIAAYDPAMKLVMMLRDPAERAYSAWNMHRQLRANSWDVLMDRLATQTPEVRDAMITYCEQIESNDFTATIRRFIGSAGHNALEPGLIERGLYARQIAEYQRHFPKEQILILESARCRANLAAELDRVAAFLGLTPVAWEKLPVKAKDKHERTYTAPIPEEARSLLRAYFREPNEELFSMLGERYAWNDWIEHQPPRENTGTSPK